MPDINTPAPECKTRVITITMEIDHNNDSAKATMAVTEDGKECRSTSQQMLGMARILNMFASRCMDEAANLIHQDELLYLKTLEENANHAHENTK